MSGVIALSMHDPSEVLSLSMPHADDRDGYVMIDFGILPDSEPLALPSPNNRSADEIARACQ
jgi:hypothetical protein